MSYGELVQNNSSAPLCFVSVKFSVMFMLNVSQQEFGLCSFHMEASVMTAVFALAAQGKQKG